jgi:hypothetical protein
MYNLSIGAIFKDEAPYLKEWLEHYIKREVDHFYLIDDSSTDNYKEVIEPYKDRVTVIPFDRTTEIYIKGGRIVEAYHKCFSPIQNQTEWMLICDIDEYVWSPRSVSMKSQLKELGKDYDSIVIQGANFGSNGHEKQPKQIVNSFTRRQILKETDEGYGKEKTFGHIKSMTKIEALESFGVHVHNLKENKKIFWKDSKSPFDKQYFTLNHYMTQSKEKWRNNLEKTNACPAQYKKGSRRTMEEFYQKDKDYSIIEDFGLINQNNLISSE